MTFHLQTRKREREREKQKRIRNSCPSSDGWNEMDLMDGRLCKRGRIIQTGVSSGKGKSKRNTRKGNKIGN
jgi:hypothetical protein